MAWAITALIQNISENPIIVDVSEDSGNLYVLTNSQTVPISEIDDEDISNYLSSNFSTDGTEYVGILYFDLSTSGSSSFSITMGDMFGVAITYPGAGDEIVLVYDLSDNQVKTGRKTHKTKGQVINQI